MKPTPDAGPPRRTTRAETTKGDSVAGDVQEFGGEFALPIGDNLEIHPGANGGWAVVAVSRGEVLVNFADIDEAASYAKAGN